jgi:hypothetical protein
MARGSSVPLLDSGPPWPAGSAGGGVVGFGRGPLPGRCLAPAVGHPLPGQAGPEPLARPLPLPFLVPLPFPLAGGADPRLPERA